MKLCDEYENFLKEQSHVGPSTLKTLRAHLKGFPEPDKLNAKWFRERMKNVAPTTVKKEVGIARRVLKWLKRDIAPLSRDNLRLPRLESTITVEDLYSVEELDKVLKASLHTRDRAMFEVLYESAARASELLSMTFENVSFEDDGTAMVIVKGKTGTRQIPLYESVPILRTWMDQHPTGKGYIWTINQKPFSVLGHRQLHHLVKLAIENAGLKREKKRIVHMFRHTRATELVRLGVHGQALRKFMGWTKGSNMESVYVHLSTQDVNDTIKAKVFGFDVAQVTRKSLLTSKVCPDCQTQNDQNSRFCSECNMPLSKEAIVTVLRQKEQKSIDLEQLVQERVDESMERVVQAFSSAIQSIEDTKTLKDLAVAFAKKMKEESASTNSE